MSCGSSVLLRKNALPVGGRGARLRINTVVQLANQHHLIPEYAVSLQLPPRYFRSCAPLHRNAPIEFVEPLNAQHDLQLTQRAIDLRQPRRLQHSESIANAHTVPPEDPTGQADVPSRPLVRRLCMLRDASPTSQQHSAEGKSVGHVIGVQQKTPRVKLRKILYKYMKDSSSPTRIDGIDTAAKSASDAEQQDMAPTSLTSREIDFLEARGHSLADLEDWSTFLSADSPFEAVNALQFKMATNPDFTYPLTVLSVFLSCPRIPAAHLHVLLDAVNRHHASAEPPQPAGAWFAVFHHLSRHARQSSPSLIEQVTRSLLTGLETANSSSPAEMTDLVNKAMLLVSTPTAIEPFKSAAVQEQALVAILQFMADHNPPLPVNKAGYLAFVRVQLLLPKTERERYWARLKALSWPPWKQDRTAMDSLLGPEYGVSKAAATLSRMKPDGYQLPEWASVASVYAGSDVDGTPTIQTRAILPRSYEKTAEHAVWAARITATRTLREAWAYWLAYEHSHPSKTRASAPVLAIMRKLATPQAQNNSIHHRRRHDSIEIASDLTSYQPVLPGDDCHVSPEPPSSHLRTYTATPPPTLHDFFLDMRQKNFDFDQAGTAFLVRTSVTFEHGLEYLRAYNKDMVCMLWTDDLPDHGQVPTAIVAASACLLLRFPVQSLPYRFNSASLGLCIPSTVVSAAFPLELNLSLVRAVSLLAGSAAESTVRSHAWQPLFKRLARAPRDCFKLRQPVGQAIRTVEIETETAWTLRFFYIMRSRIAAYRLAQQSIAIMNTRSTVVDSDIFVNVCQILQSAGLSYHRAIQLQSIAQRVQPALTMLPYSLITDEGAAIAAEGPDKFLITLYDTMSGRAGLGQKPAAGLFAPLSPMVAHTWVRTLGVWRFHAAVQTLVHWMCDENVISFDEDTVSDRRHLRKFITVVRAVLERSDRPSASPSAGHKLDKDGVISEISAVYKQPIFVLNANDAAAAPPELIADVRHAIEKHFGPQFGSWPSDAELEYYISRDVNNGNKVGQH